MKRLILIGFCFWMALFSQLSSAQGFVAGKDYQIIDNSGPSKIDGKVAVLEFFSYGCPWCFRLEPHLDSWLKKEAKRISFQRVPVAFESGWEAYAKAYYVAEALDVEAKLSPKLFEAIQVKNRRLVSQKRVGSVFVAAGVDKQTFDDAYTSPIIDAKLAEGKKLLRQYAIYGVPAMVVAGRYRVDLSMTNGDFDRLLAVTDYLINQSK